MGFHHLALATRDIKATHEFYTAAMGFELVKVAVGPAGKRGFAKHLFYDTGNGELIAFWDLHDPGLPADWSGAKPDPSAASAIQPVVKLIDGAAGILMKGGAKSDAR